MKTKKLFLAVTLNGKTIERDVFTIDTLVGTIGLLQDGDSLSVYCTAVDVSGQQ